MATHDYILANQSGASFRTDLNNALAAIVSNNSNNSSPSTTYAYQWWADTSNNVLKIRNSANNDWIELLQLDGTLTLEDGSASAPALAFRDDLNTGIYSSEADSLNVTTGGVDRVKIGDITIFNDSGADVDFRIEGDTNANLFYVDAGNDAVGIGTSSPLTDAELTISAADTPSLAFQRSGTGKFENAIAIESGHFFFKAGADSSTVAGLSDVFKIESTGSVMVGTTSGTGKFIVQDSSLPKIQANFNGAAHFELGVGGSGGGFAITTGHSTTFNHQPFANRGTDTNLTTRLTITGTGNLESGGLIVASAGFAQVDNAQSLISQSSTGSATTTYFIGNQAITTSSDKRIKENIVDTSLNAITELNKVRVVDFNWNDPSDQAINSKNARGKWIGCIAQEIVDIFPHSVNAPRPKGKEIDYDSEHLWTMEYEHLVPVLIKAVQELSAKVAALESL